MSEEGWDPVPVAVPRWWFRNWMFHLWNLAFGYTLCTKQPLRWLMFRDLTERERDELRMRLP